MEISNRESTAMEHCDEGEWLAAERFFQLESGTLKAGNAIRLHDGWDLPCEWKPYQLAEIFQLYKIELSDNNGFLLGNMMGLGKTRTSLGIILVGYIHSLMELHQEEHPNNHLSRPPVRQDGEEDDNGVNAPKCPSQHLFPFTCTCNPASAFYGTKPRKALTVVSGSGQSTSAWFREVRQMKLLTSKWCNDKVDYPLRIAKQHVGANQKGSPDMPALTNTEVVETRRRIDTDSWLKKWNDSVPERCYKQGGETLYERPLYTITKPVENHSRATKHRPSPTSARFVLIASESTFMKHVIHPLQRVQVKIQQTIHAKGTQKVITRDIQVENKALVIGRTIFDEFHNSKNAYTKFNVLYDDIRANNKGYQWKSWALSGTPMENGISEMLIFVTKALRGLKNWETTKDDGFVETTIWKQRIFKAIGEQTAEKAGIGGIAMSKAWTACSKKAARGSLQDTLDSEGYKKLVDVGANIAATFLFRRTYETTDPWGRRLSSIPAEFEVVLRPCQNDAYNTIISDAEKDYESTTGHVLSLSRHDMTAIASYPGLAKYLAYRLQYDGNAESCLRGVDVYPEWSRLDKTPVKQMLSMITTNSPKLDAVYKIVDEALNSTRPNPEHDASPSCQVPSTLPARVIIASYKPITQLITILALQEKYPNEEILVFHGGMSPVVRDERKAQWDNPNGPRILVMSMGFAEAITLTEASFIILMEPQDRQSKQDQVLFRIYRIGQLAARCCAYILYNPNEPQEVSILSHQMFKTTARNRLTTGNADSTSDGATVETGDIMDWTTGEDQPYNIDEMP